MADLPQYPAGLPNPLQEGYAFSPVSPLLRTKMQSGRSKQRVRYRKTPTQVSVSWFFESSPQAQLFEAWYEETIDSGAMWFETTLQTPQGFMPYKCRFVDIYDGPILSPPRYWKFTATLELEERPVTGGGWATYYPDALLYSNIIDLAINREWPAP